MSTRSLKNGHVLCLRLKLEYLYPSMVRHSGEGRNPYALGLLQLDPGLRRGDELGTSLLLSVIIRNLIAAIEFVVNTDL